MANSKKMNKHVWGVLHWIPGAVHHARKHGGECASSQSFPPLRRTTAKRPLLLLSDCNAHVYLFVLSLITSTGIIRLWRITIAVLERILWGYFLEHVFLLSCQLKICAAKICGDTCSVECVLGDALPCRVVRLAKHPFGNWWITSLLDPIN
jgi:hypothetical protein